jgi:hypothetical protein
MNSTIGAPPGSITNGSRPPMPRRPSDCSSVPRPQITKVALSSCTASAGGKFSALLIRKTDAIGDAAMTSTC